MTMYRLIGDNVRHGAYGEGPQIETFISFEHSGWGEDADAATLIQKFQDGVWVPVKLVEDTDE